MGGFRSTRWRGTLTRAETDPLPRLDISDLRRWGALDPGAYATYSWFVPGQGTARIASIMHRDRSVLTLRYEYGAPFQDEWTAVADDIEIEYTHCHFGGSRPWFRCPRCCTRRGVLFRANGRFRCRVCHNLAYSSTLEDRHQRALRRCRKLQHQLHGSGYDHPIWELPDRRDGMSRFRYVQLAERLKNELMLHAGAIMRDLEGLAGSEVPR
jgi:hypothetical protein